MELFQRARKRKKTRRWRLVVLVGIFFLCIAYLLFIKQVFSFSLVPKTAPLPTGMDPNFMTSVDDCFIPTAAAYGYTLRITAGFRSAEEQDTLFEQGRTTDGHIITEAAPYQSIHNYGFAVDVVDRWRGYNIDWQELINIGAYCGLESGGSGDLPHFEHRAGLSTADFKAGKRPPPLVLPCPLMAVRAAADQPLTLDDLKSCGAPVFGD